MLLWKEWRYKMNDDMRVWMSMNEYDKSEDIKMNDDIRLWMSMNDYEWEVKIWRWTMIWDYEWLWTSMNDDDE